MIKTYLYIITILIHIVGKYLVKQKYFSKILS